MIADEELNQFLFFFFTLRLKNLIMSSSSFYSRPSIWIIAVSVTLRATGNPDYPYFEGMFVQARMASCGSDKPIGTFSIPDGDTFMQIMDCHSERPMV